MKAAYLFLIQAALFAAAADSERWEISTREGTSAIWGRAGELKRVYFSEFLPALFARTLTLDGDLPAGSTLDWIFTGEQGGFTVRIRRQSVELIQRYYDSYGLHQQNPPKQRAPEREWDKAEVRAPVSLRSVTVTLDNKLGLHLALNGRPVVRQRCLLDVSRHQLLWTPADPGASGLISGGLERPARQAVDVRVNTARRHQSIYGFGGILSAPAYAMLSPGGRERWWQYLRDYNLLLHREYPNGNRLKPDLSNFGILADATPHYYGDNFPNGEISDFEYLRRFRALGGHVLFEFWDLPPWARRTRKDGEGHAAPQPPILDEDVRAVTGYCRILQDRTGAQPEIVGVQNEVVQPAEIWSHMVLSLRQGLDRAGFLTTRIHMPDSGRLSGGILTASALRASSQAWKAIDYAATHLYDFQDFFEDPDGYDARIEEWNRAVQGKPFLSTEIAVNRPHLQAASYRVAFAMAQLYHKNMALMNARALVYCWTLLDVEQPSFSASRALFAVSRSGAMEPVASSYQLRVFGAYSRRLRQAMVRVEAWSPSPDLLATAHEGPGGKRTVILTNRGLAPVAVNIHWPGARFREVELAGPYQPNIAAAAAAGPITLQPGEIATLTNVPLGAVPLARLSAPGRP